MISFQLWVIFSWTQTTCYCFRTLKTYFFPLPSFMESNCFAMCLIIRPQLLYQLFTEKEEKSILTVSLCIIRGRTNFITVTVHRFQFTFIVTVAFKKLYSINLTYIPVQAYSLLFLFTCLKPN